MPLERSSFRRRVVRPTSASLLCGRRRRGGRRDRNVSCSCLQASRSRTVPSTPAESTTRRARTTRFFFANHAVSAPDGLRIRRRRARSSSRGSPGRSRRRSSRRARVVLSRVFFAPWRQRPCSPAQNAAGALRPLRRRRDRAPAFPLRPCSRRRRQRRRMEAVFAAHRFGDGLSSRSAPIRRQTSRAPALGEGLQGRVVERGRIRRDDFARTPTGSRRYLWAPSSSARHPARRSSNPDLAAAASAAEPRLRQHLLEPGEGVLPVRTGAPSPTGAELAPHYATAKRISGRHPHHILTSVDRELESVAESMGRKDSFHATDVASSRTRAKRESRCPIPSSAARDRSAPAAFCAGLHVGCPRREEHPRQELPLARREERRRDRPGGPARRDRARRRRIRSPSGALHGVVCEEEACRARTASGALRRRARHGAAPARLQARARDASGFSDRLGADVRTTAKRSSVSPRRQAERRSLQGIAIGSGFWPDRSPRRAGALLGGISFMRFLAAPMPTRETASPGDEDDPRRGAASDRLAAPSLQSRRGRRRR